MLIKNKQDFDEKEAFMEQTNLSLMNSQRRACVELPSGKPPSNKAQNPNLLYLGVFNISIYLFQRIAYDDRHLDPRTGLD